MIRSKYIYMLLASLAMSQMDSAYAYLSYSLSNSNGVCASKEGAYTSCVICTPKNYTDLTDDGGDTDWSVWADIWASENYSVISAQCSQLQCQRDTAQLVERGEYSLDGNDGSYFECTANGWVKITNTCNNGQYWNGSSCVSCPKYGEYYATSNSPVQAGSNGATVCYVPRGSYSDPTGSYDFVNNCYWNPLASV